MVMMGWPSRYRLAALSASAFVVASQVNLVCAHEHHNVEEIDETQPVDAILWIHMALQLIAWGFMFPIGMVLGLSRSRWHVPLQTTATLLTVAGIYLGHHHKGRQFPYTAHGTMAKVIFWLMLAQGTIGIYLKLHINERSARPWIVRIHGVIGKAFPIIGWTQMLLGVVTLLGYCMDGALGQCLAHYIMGSAFIGYATILLIMLHLGAAWLKKTGRSQEFLDSWVIMVWGIVNTFTEHHDAWNENWSHKDMQHTMMGVLWWAGGALGIFLSRNGKRSFVPAVIIIMTGWGMSAHEQALMLSSKIHGLFGYSLMAAGLVRLIEIFFVLNDGPSMDGQVRLLQYLPPYLLVLGGTLFMSATDEELHHVHDLDIDHVSYALFVFSLSFVLFLYISFLVHLYSHSGRNAEVARKQEALDALGAGAKENGYQAIRLETTEDRGGPIIGAESFELADRDGSEDDDDDAATKVVGMNGNGRANGMKRYKENGGDEVDWLDGQAR